MLALMQPGEPTFALWYRGVNISDEMQPEMLSCTYVDKVHGEADEIDVTCHDTDGKWRGPWCPEQGDTADLEIGYKGLPLTPCGTFELDEPTARLTRGGDTFSMKGVAAPVTKSLRTTKSRGFESQSLREIAQTIAGEHDLTIVGTPPEVTFERISQRRERDLAFLSRMADAYGAYFTVRGRQMIFAERREVHERAPVFTIRAESDDYLTADLKRAAHKTYSKAKLTYYDGNEKKKIEAEVEDTSVKTGDTLRIDERVENEGQAQARAKSELEKENMKRQTGTLLLPGNPLMVAGQIIALDAGFGRWAALYLIKSSRHHIVRTQSYTTSIEIAAVPEGTKSAAPKAAPATGNKPAGAEPRAQGRFAPGGQ